MRMQLGAFSALFVILTSFPALSHADPNIPSGDGTIRLYNYHLNEFIDVQFRNGETFDQDALAAINHIMRSRAGGAEAAIALELILLVDHLQDHFNADTIEIISGYRSPALNQRLRQQGHAVSPQSLHMAGRALDIHIDEIKEETLRNYLHSLHIGGVGFYGSFDFVHIDSGPARRWSEPTPSKRKLIGVLPKSRSVRLVSDRNDYLPGSQLRFVWKGLSDSGANSIQDLQLEHFHRGHWVPIQHPPLAPNQRNFVLLFDDNLFKSSGDVIRYGRYRWTFRFSAAKELHSSNEFYLKSL